MINQDGEKTMTKIKTDDDDQIVRDGGKVVVRMAMMDAAQRAVVANTAVFDSAGHKPGYAITTDADRQKRVAIYEGYNRRLNDAWKKPPPVPAVAATATVDKTPTQTVAAPDHYATYDQRMGSRWKGAA